MKPPQLVAVLGSGWLGLPLIHTLVRAGYAARGSYRREATRAAVEDAGADPFLLDLPELSGPLSAFLDGCDTVVITLPPGGRQHGAATTERYLAALLPLRPHLSELRVIYTSSTGVYGRTAAGVVTEATVVAPDTDSSRAVVAAESWLRQHAPRLTVLRLAGLFGPGREPAAFFPPGHTVSQGEAPVNMVHQADAIAAVRWALETGSSGTYNVCAATHPTKAAFYTARSQLTARPLPIFATGGAAGKRIDSSALRAAGWSPRYDDLLHLPD